MWISIQHAEDIPDSTAYIYRARKSRTICYAAAIKFVVLLFWLLLVVFTLFIIRSEVPFGLRRPASNYTRTDVFLNLRFVWWTLALEIFYRYLVEYDSLVVYRKMSLNSIGFPNGRNQTCLDKKLLLFPRERWHAIVAQVS